ncbi:HSP20 family molecular chaperone IbpA [Peribacillus deserti]|uniref:HSP20 family molecular chaperone IbpA n=1 Tax=Peribacillus deserti TaxID=673318 RepID=A0ABS2QE20_9BACI|nr:Hsp20/alpha crystallin family protein [Peribacillus deserti]MBM7691412.1 HSP20 family molecular chaperone IbpA [Peribacillus deserti]
MDFDEWMKAYSLDPFTTYLDYTVFRVDVFNTVEAYIVEALLDHCHSKDYMVLVKENELVIRLLVEKEHLERKIYFPSSIHSKTIQSTLKDDILEVKVFK